MYDDSYRSRFESVAAATYSCDINKSDEETIKFTHTHNHRDFEILVIKSGKAYFNIDGCSFLVERGDVILVNPYEIHSAYTTKDFIPFSYYCITFDMSMLLATPTHPATKTCQKLIDGYMKFNHLIKNQDIYNIILNTEKIFSEKKEGWEFLVSSAIFVFFGTLFKTKEYILLNQITKNDTFAKEVLEFIEMNFYNSITSADVAEKLCYNKSYFCRLFKKNFGQSFSEYLNFYRINYATELLRKGHSVTEAAISSGFDNLSYFTKMFKKYNKTLPSKIKN